MVTLLDRRTDSVDGSVDDSAAVTPFAGDVNEVSGLSVAPRGGLPREFVGWRCERDGPASLPAGRAASRRLEAAILS
jgi:hypothetical protein